MRVIFWPRSLFGRLLAASVLALLVAQLASLMLVARERERFILQTSVREWSRRIAEVSTMLQTLEIGERDLTAVQLSERPWGFGHGLHGEPPDAGLRGPPAGPLPPREIVRDTGVAAGEPLHGLRRGVGADD